MQYTIFTTLFFSAVFGTSQAGPDCATLVARLCPRRGLIPEKLLGRWRPYGNYFVDKSQVRPALLNVSVECGAYTMWKQADSENFGIKLEYDAVERKLHTERFGENVVHPQVSSQWKKHFTKNGDPNEWWHEAVLATDYENYWLQYECADTNGVAVENIGMRTKTGSATRKEKQIFASIVRSYGFDLSSPAGAWVPVHQPRTCFGNGDDSRNTPYVPEWFVRPWDEE